MSVRRVGELNSVTCIRYGTDAGERAEVPCVHVKSVHIGTEDMNSRKSELIGRVHVDPVAPRIINLKTRCRPVGATLEVDSVVRG